MPKAEAQTENSLKEGGVVHNPPLAELQSEAVQSSAEKEEASVPPPPPQEPDADQ
jgi:hypothetical protein